MSQNLNGYFDEIYCTNLDSRPDRWLRVNARFQEQGVQARRFSAADGDSEELVREYDMIRVRLAEAAKSEPKYLKNSCALGCLISGMRIIEDAKRKGHQRILLFDDDVLFHRNFDELLSNMNGLPPWKLLYLGCSQHQWDGIQLSDTHLYGARHTHGTFAVGIDASVFDEVLSLYSGREQNCDVYLMEIQDRYPQESLVLFPNLVIADVRESSIRGRRSQRAHAKKVKWQLADYELSYSHYVEGIFEALSLGLIGSVYRWWVGKRRRGR
ncbi:MAG: hypothetical protein HOC23_07115 [Halieaceae bacterium]|jgi:GR25 family glycosyltransferase involved in LPS biosynthesis|nr:hypothetical protein [Halieaceae bacterium]